MTDEYEYFSNKLPNRVYITKPFGQTEPNGRKLRFISKVFDPSEQHHFAKIKDELVIRVTTDQRWEVKALFYEDTRDIQSITIQRFTIANDKPHKSSFTFSGDEISKLYDLLRAVKSIDLDQKEKQRLEDDVLADLLLSADEKRQFLQNNVELIVDVLNNDLSTSEIVALAYRKKQLEIFDSLLHDPIYFRNYQQEQGIKGKEAIWQAFFERNPWIFGYGLDYIFTTGFDDRKLEQVTSGHAINQSGKRVDALLRTRGLISSLCFVEIKTHDTELIHHSSPYRAECWRISDELAGSVAQIQKTVQKAMENIRHKLELHSKDGIPTGELAYLYQPKSFVLIGSLGEFQTPTGINDQKYSSFELYRRNLTNPEIITFDEMFHRAKHIVRHSEEEKLPGKTPQSYQDRHIEVRDEDIPF